MYNGEYLYRVDWDADGTKDLVMKEPFQHGSRCREVSYFFLLEKGSLVLKDSIACVINVQPGRVVARVDNGMGGGEGLNVYETTGERFKLKVGIYRRPLDLTGNKSLFWMISEYGQEELSEEAYSERYRQYLEGK